MSNTVSVIESADRSFANASVAEKVTLPEKLVDPDDTPLAQRLMETAAEKGLSPEQEGGEEGQEGPHWREVRDLLIGVHKNPSTSLI